MSVYGLGGFIRWNTVRTSGTNHDTNVTSTTYIWDKSWYQCEKHHFWSGVPGWNAMVPHLSMWCPTNREQIICSIKVHEEETPVGILNSIIWWGWVLAMHWYQIFLFQWSSINDMPFFSSGIKTCDTQTVNVSLYVYTPTTLPLLEHVIYSSDYLSKIAFCTPYDTFQSNQWIIYLFVGTTVHSSLEKLDWRVQSNLGSAS